MEDQPNLEFGLPMLTESALGFNCPGCRPIRNVHDKACKCGRAAFVVKRNPSPHKEVIVGCDERRIESIVSAVVLELNQKTQIHIRFANLVKRVFKPCDTGEERVAMAHPKDRFNFNLLLEFSVSSSALRGRNASEHSVGSIIP